MQPLRNLFVLVSIAAVVLVALPSIAAAHSSLTRSIPAAGTTIDQAPDELVLTFSDPVTVPEGVIRVLDLAGRNVASSAPQVDGRTVRIPLEDEGPGTRVVDWSIISDHSTVVRGAFSYTVAEPTPGARVDPSEARSGSGSARVEATRMLRSGAGTGLALAVAALLWFARRSARRRATAAPAALLTGASGVAVAAAVAAAVIVDDGVLRAWFVVAAVSGGALLVAAAARPSTRVLASTAVFPIVAMVGLLSVPAPELPPTQIEQRVTFDGGTTATVVLDRAVAGLADLQVDVRDASGAPSTSVVEASMRYRPADESLGDFQFALVPDGAGRYVATDVLVPFAGAWSFDLVVSKDRFSADLASFEADVEPNEELAR